MRYIIEYVRYSDETDQVYKILYHGNSSEEVASLFYEDDDEDDASIINIYEV